MEKFYINDYSILIKNWYHIFPNKNMSRNEILNSLTRFGVLAILLFIIIRSNIYWYIIPITSIILSLYLGINNDSIKTDQIIKNTNIDKINKCRLPTINNPYMNILSNDSKVKLPACEYDKNLVDKYYKFNLYQNSNDIFENKNLERQFYTVPITTIPNDTLEFGKWLYNTNGNCKYDGTRCLQYEDERYH